ncbi:unnamed protein product [marine sediment metagenome]|uniref:Uncharacterized protein n=1 Tax=marine sediment metagenome TaxID=412755 RepID=X0ULN7_9ZZZZ
MKVPMDKCRKKLAVLWLVGAGVLFFLVFFQSIFEWYGEDVGQAWEWLLPTIMPTLSLVVGILLAGVAGEDIKAKFSDRFVFRLAFSLSSVYLAVILLTFFALGLGDNPFELMARSHFWLAPCQGLVSACVGVFFVKGQSA